MGKSQKSQTKYFIVIGLFLVTVFFSRELLYAPPRVYEIRLDEFPLTIGSWEGQASELSASIERIHAVLGTKAVLPRLYINSEAENQVIDLFVTYSEKDHRAFHPPGVSFVAAGNTIIKSGIECIPLLDREKVPELRVNMFLGKTPHGKIIYLYWFGIGDRLLANYYLSALYLLWDTIRGVDSPISMVRVAIPLIDDDLEKTMEVATGFIQQIVPLLPEYLVERVPPGEYNLDLG